MVFDKITIGTSPTAAYMGNFYIINTLKYICIGIADIIFFPGLQDTTTTHNLITAIFLVFNNITGTIMGF